MPKFLDQKFVEALEIQQAAERKKSRGDKRRSHRQAIRVPIQIKLENENPDAPWTSATLRDISPRGVLLAIDHHVDAGLSILLRLPSETPDDSAPPLVCRICHCRKDSHELYLIGVEFVGQVNAKPTSTNSEAELERIKRSILL